MLEGLREVIAQIALIVAVAALLAGVLGWLLGRASGQRRAEQAAAARTASRLTHARVRTAPAFSPLHAQEAVGDVPSPVAEEFLPAVSPILGVGVTEPDEAPLLADPADADVDGDEDPDRTVLRPAPGMRSPSGTPHYAPPRSTFVAARVSASGLSAARPASVEEGQELRSEHHAEVQALRSELRVKELELGRLEAGALSAWDRTVPRLEARISDLLDENVSLRRQIRDAEEHSGADARTVERLRSLVAERDSRLAEIQAQS